MEVRLALLSGAAACCLDLRCLLSPANVGELIGISYLYEYLVEKRNHCGNLGL